MLNEQVSRCLGPYISNEVQGCQSGNGTLVCVFSPSEGPGHALAGRGRAPRGRRRQKGTLIVYSVPYSEHSSYQELCQMVDFLQPTKIIPSVNNDGSVKASRMVESLRGPA